jgi:hypothetical protein
VKIERCGYDFIGSYVLPEQSWWEHYYTPIERKLPELEEKYRDNPGAMYTLEAEREEITLYRRFADQYGYVFYVMRG